MQFTVILRYKNMVKNKNINYYIIIHICMNTCRGKENFKNLQILLDSGFSSKMFKTQMKEIFCDTVANTSKKFYNESKG